MSWSRMGDTAPLHPQVMAVVGLAPDEPWAVNEMRGFIFSLYMASGAHDTDYVVDFGTVQLYGSERWALLLSRAVALGLVEEVTVQGLPALRLLVDPKFVHLRLKEEITASRNRAADNQSKTLRALALYRDGDNCRWCGKEVRWRGPVSPTRGELDHLDPDALREPGNRSDVDDVVIACKSCNSSRRDNRAAFHAKYPVPLEVPETPYYSAATAEYIERHTAFRVAPTYPSDPIISVERPRAASPGDRSAVASSDLGQPVRVTAPPTDGDQVRADAPYIYESRVASPVPGSPVESRPSLEKVSRLSGSGVRTPRDGTGRDRAGPGLAGHGPALPRQEIGKQVGGPFGGGRRGGRRRGGRRSAR
ncbi:MAG: HNH endonuclease [Buchananella hordeovulneris]|nr:HNH endonuclease [Buchananella hordeovulneris]